MGVKHKIEKSLLPKRYQNLSLIPTDDGVSQSVYFLGNQFVLKIFDDRSKAQIDKEIRLHQQMIKHNLLVPKIVDSFKIDRMEVLIYEQIAGTSPKETTPIQVEAIGEFLAKLHKIEFDFELDSSRHNKESLKSLVDRYSVTPIKKSLELIECNLKADTLIHADIFRDNAKFVDNRLSGVYDFSDASMGDRYFDLGVVAISWCIDNMNLNKDKLKALFSGYGKEICLREFVEYMKFVSLYYATTRYIKNGDYKELLEIYDLLKKI